MSTTSEDAVHAKTPKIAVVVVHGMGEQQPMETLWGVVNALWTTDGSVIPARDNEVFSKPERLTGSFELRRLTTRHGANGKRVDFFEFYWAHLMAGNKFGHVLGWAQSLFVRPYKDVPQHLLRYWWGGWAAFAAIIVVAAIVIALLGNAWAVVLAPAVLLGLWRGIRTWFAHNPWLVDVLGDAARYLSPKPHNVEARQRIREAAISLLKAIHWTREYDRVIVVGHSLGSVIAYDALNYAWGQIDKEDFAAVHAPGSAAADALTALETAADDLKNKPNSTAQTAYRAAQRTYAHALAQPAQRKPPLWLVSDFITLGSPLSKADVLIATKPDDFASRVKRRELATDPPTPDQEDSKKFSFQTGTLPLVPHHAAVFAPTVWTNIFFCETWFVFGDLIGGPVGRHFGPGVLDVELPPGRSFQHCDYWKEPEKPTSAVWIDAFRRAVNLRNNAQLTVWNGALAKRLPPT